MARTSSGFTEDERRAERATTLATFLMGARYPVGTAAIYERFYAELGEANRRKTFSRDRDLLASAGVLVRDAGWRDGEKAWEIDADASFAGVAELSPLEAIALDIACQPLLEDHGFTHGEALRHALAKIDRTFGDPDQAVRTSPAERSRASQTVLGCIDRGRVVNVTYRDAKGTVSKRDFAPYGTFPCRGRGYVVGDFIEEDEDGAAHRRRTLRLDRIESARETTQAAVVPEGFNIADYLLLPFQIGPTTCTARFFVPENRREALSTSCLRSGAVANGKKGTEWTVDVSDVDDAARWAVAQGIRPLEPSELVESWEKCLKEACHANE